MPTYVLYARKSTESADRQAASIPNQVQDLRTLASRLGIPIAEVLTEERSAKTPGRPIFTALLRRIERGEVTGLLCWKPDRLARNYYDAGCLQQALSDGKLKEILTPEKTYTQAGADQLIAALEFSLGAKYSTDLSQRVWWGNEKKFQHGWINHCPMLGYLLDPVTKQTIDDPERWPLLSRMLELVHTGALLPLEVWKVAVAEWRLTNRKGLPLSRSNFYRILRSSFYAGINQLKDGRRYQGAHHAMLTEAQFLHIQEILDRTARPKKKRHVFAFSALFKCATCGCTITGEQHVKPSGRRYLYYRCFRSKPTVPCREPAVAVPVLEAQLAADLARLRAPEKIHAFLLARAERVTEREAGLERAAAASRKRAIVAVSRAESTLLDLRLDGTITDEEFRQRKAALAAKRQGLEAGPVRSARSPAATGASVREVLAFAQRAVEIFRTGTGVQRRMILEAVASNYELSNRKLRYSLREPFACVATAAASCNWSGCLDDLRTWMVQHPEWEGLPNLDLEGVSLLV